MSEILSKCVLLSRAQSVKVLKPPVSWEWQSLPWERLRGMAKSSFGSSVKIKRYVLIR